MRKIAKWTPFIVILALACAAFPAWARQASSSPAGISTAQPASKSSPKKSTKKRRPHGPPIPKAPSADRISEIQSALTRGGYYQGDSTGKWDSNTVAAVQKFQSANAIDATGKLDARTLQKLGLGSEIAGVSAPKPIMPASPDQASPPASAPSPQSSMPATRASASATTIAAAAPPEPAGPPR